MARGAATWSRWQCRFLAPSCPKLSSSGTMTQGLLARQAASAALYELVAVAVSSLESSFVVGHLSGVRFFFSLSPLANRVRFVVPTSVLKQSSA